MTSGFSEPKAKQSFKGFQLLNLRRNSLKHASDKHEFSDLFSKRFLLCSLPLHSILNIPLGVKFEAFVFASFLYLA